MGEWKSHEEVDNERGIFVPLDIVSAAGAEVGDNLDSLTFTYTMKEAYLALWKMKTAQVK